MYLGSITFRHPNANVKRNIALYEDVKKFTKKGLKVNEAIDRIVESKKFTDDKGNPIKSTNAYRIYNMVAKKVRQAGVISQ